MAGADKQPSRVVSFNLSSEQLQKLRKKDQPQQSQGYQMQQDDQEKRQTHWQSTGPDQIGSTSEEKKVDSEGDDTDYRLAIKLANDAIERGTDLHDAYYERSICYHRLEEYEQSLKDIDVAIELQPDNYEYHLQRSYVLFAMVRRREARDSIKRAIHLRAAMPSTRLQDLYNMIIHAMMDKNFKNKDTITTSNPNTTTEPVTDDDNNFKVTTNYNDPVSAMPTDNTNFQQDSGNPTKLVTKNRIFTTRGHGNRSNEMTHNTVNSNTAMPVAGSSNVDTNIHNDIKNVNPISTSSYQRQFDSHYASRMVNDEGPNLVREYSNNITRNINSNDYNNDNANANCSNNDININNTKNNIIKSYHNYKNNNSNNDKCKTNNNTNCKQSNISNNFKKTQYINTSDTVSSTAIHGYQQQNSLSTMLVSQMMSNSGIASVNQSLNPSGKQQLQNDDKQQHINNLNISRDNYPHQQPLSQADHDNLRRSERIFLSSPIVSPPILPRTNSLQYSNDDFVHQERSTKRPRNERCLDHQQTSSFNNHRQTSMSDAVGNNGDSDIDIDVDDSNSINNNNQKTIVNNTHQSQQQMQKNITFNNNHNNNITVSKLPTNLKPGMSIAIVPINPAPAITVTAATTTTKDDGASYSTKYKRLRRDRERARRGTCKLCIINPDDLAEMQQDATTKTMRVIAPIEHWLYSGELSVDSNSLSDEIPRFIITLDGDQEKHPFVFSRDSILDNVIREVHVKSVSELRKGARICCYWNKDLSCLATGVVTSRTFEATKSLVSVKYDNGGLSALSLDDLRLLPPDYPKFVSQNNIALAGRFSTHFKNHNGPKAQGLCIKPAVSSLKNIHEQLEQHQQEHKQPKIQQQKTTKLIMMKVIPSQQKSQMQNVNQNTGSSSSKQTTHYHDNQLHSTNQPQSQQSHRQQAPARQLNEHHAKSYAVTHNDPTPRVVEISKANKPTEDEVDAYTFVDSNQDTVKDTISQVNQARCDDRGPDNGSKNASKKPTINELIIKIKRDKTKYMNIASISENEKDAAEKLCEAGQTVIASEQKFSALPMPADKIPTTDSLLNLISRASQSDNEFKDEPIIQDGEPEILDGLQQGHHLQVLRNEDELNYDQDRESLGDGGCNRLEIVDEEPSESIERQVQEVQNSLVSSLVEESTNSDLIATSDDSVAPIYSLPASDQSHLWPWHFEGPPKKIKRNGRAHKYHYRSIRRGNEILSVGDAAELLPKDKKTLPFIAKIDSFWATGRGEMKVLVRWYYRLSETKGPDPHLEDGQNAVFESAHPDINDIRSIHKAAVILSWTDYKSKYLGHKNDDSPGTKRNIYYIAGYYDPTVHTKTLKPDVVQSPFGQ